MTNNELWDTICALEYEEKKLRNERMELRCEYTRRTTTPLWGIGNILLWKALDRKESKVVKVVERIANPREWVYKVKYELSNGAEVTPSVLAHEEDLVRPRGVENKYHAKVNRKPKLKTWEERSKVKGKGNKKPKKVVSTIDLAKQLELLNNI
jgi:hypothetical protein